MDGSPRAQVELTIEARRFSRLPVAAESDKTSALMPYRGRLFLRVNRSALRFSSFVLLRG